MVGEVLIVGEDAAIVMTVSSLIMMSLELFLTFRPTLEDSRMRKIAAVSFVAVLAVCSSLTAHALDQDKADRIKALVDTGMQYYWSGGDVKKAEAEVFKGITLHGR